MKKAGGLVQKRKVEPFLGFTDCNIVKIDCDVMVFRVVKRIAYIVMRKCGLNGFIILKSSKNHYHVVFDHYVSWEDNVSAMGWFSVLSHNPKVKDYVIMQGIKGSSTLRVVGREGKLMPGVVFRCGEQNDAIKGFLKWRRRIKRIDKNSRRNKK